VSRPRSYQTEAVIIKKTKLGEADRILTLYTPTLGKIQAVAKGVRNPKSKMAGHLELLTYSQVQLSSGRNLDTITGSQTIDSFIALKNDLTLTSYGLYMTELINQFAVDEAENQPLFQLLLETMQNMATATDRDMLLRFFEVHLLSEAGYRPQLQSCVTCRQPLKPVVNYFSPSGGGILCPSCRHTQPVVDPLSVDALKVLRFVQNNEYATVSHLKISASLSHEIESIIRDYLRYLLERDLKSVAWLDSLKQQS
jgi:DNA repair protein RecO (recombination protein O)